MEQNNDVSVAGTLKKDASKVNPNQQNPGDGSSREATPIDDNDKDEEEKKKKDDKNSKEPPSSTAPTNPQTGDSIIDLMLMGSFRATLQPGGKVTVFTLKTTGKGVLKGAELAGNGYAWARNEIFELPNKSYKSYKAISKWNENKNESREERRTEINKLQDENVKRIEELEACLNNTKKPDDKKEILKEIKELKKNNEEMDSVWNNKFSRSAHTAERVVAKQKMRDVASDIKSNLDKLQEKMNEIKKNDECLVKGDNKHKYAMLEMQHRKTEKLYNKAVKQSKNRGFLNSYKRDKGNYDSHRRKIIKEMSAEGQTKKLGMFDRNDLKHAYTQTKDYMSKQKKNVPKSQLAYTKANLQRDYKKQVEEVNVDFDAKHNKASPGR